MITIDALRAQPIRLRADLTEDMRHDETNPINGDVVRGTWWRYKARRLRSDLRPGHQWTFWHDPSTRRVDVVVDY